MIFPYSYYYSSQASCLGRVPEYIDLAVRHTVEVSNTRKILGWFPGFTR